jgi:hypothetical protein
MTGRNARHVVPNPKGGWNVRKPEASRANSSHSTQAEAERRAKESLRRTGGEVVIHDRDGKIRDSDTVPPGKDPCPPRDTRH